MKIFVYGQNVEGLKVYLSQAGHELLADVEHAEVAICYNWNSRFTRILQGIASRSIDNILIASEPSVVTPEHSSPSFLKSFSKVLQVGRPGSEFKYPIRWNLEFFSSSHRQLGVVAMSSNKISWVEGEHYSLRRRIYSELEQIDVYGPGWDMGLAENILMALKEAAIAIRGKARISTETLVSLALRPINLRGPVSNKLETLSLYKVSLVVENSAEYMSEKLLEAMLAGTIPVYVGPTPGQFEIPASLVVHAGNTVDEVAEACQIALEMDYESWVDTAKSWLFDPKTQEMWSSTNFYKKVHSEVFGPLSLRLD